MNLCRHCRHCRTRKISRSRKLCWSCFYNPDISRLYPPCLYPGASDFMGSAPLPSEATPHPPGTAGKILVMTERVTRRESLFHPDDWRWEE